MKPTGLIIDDLGSGLICVIKKNNLSFMRPVDALEHLALAAISNASVRIKFLLSQSILWSNFEFSVGRRGFTFNHTRNISWHACPVRGHCACAWRHRPDARGQPRGLAHPAQPHRRVFSLSVQTCQPRSGMISGTNEIIDRNDSLIRWLGGLWKQF